MSQVEAQKKFSKGDFIKNKEPYEGEGELLVVDFDYDESGSFHGYKCARMKGKHVKENNFDNHLIVDKGSEESYKKVA